MGLSFSGIVGRLAVRISMKLWAAVGSEGRVLEDDKMCELNPGQSFG